MSLRSVAVFCGSRFGVDAAWTTLAGRTGRAIARQGTTLVYGGGRVGLMGIVADAALTEGGTVIGVIPRSLDDREVSHRGLTELHVVETMHERKALMAELSDAFVTLPGGAGTLEEITEQWTWGQLRLHTKPSGFLDAGGYWDPMRQMVARMVESGFVDEGEPSIPVFHDDLEMLLADLDARQRS